MAFINLGEVMSKYFINPGEPIQAVLHTIGPGDEVYIMPGVYSEKINIPVSGTADAPILIKSYEKHGAIFTPGCATVALP